MTHEALLAYLHMVGCKLSNRYSNMHAAIYPRDNKPSSLEVFWVPEKASPLTPDTEETYTVYANHDRTETSSPDEVYDIARQAITQYLQEREL